MSETRAYPATAGALLVNGQIHTHSSVRGDLRPDADPELATELLVGPVYFRLMFGGELTLAFADRLVDNVLRGYGAARGTHP